MHILADNTDETQTSKKDIASQTLPFHKLLSQADWLDWILIALGTLGSIVHGLAQPVGYLLLGKALDAYGNHINNFDEMVEAIKKIVPYVWYMAFATFPAGILGNFFPHSADSDFNLQNLWLTVGTFPIMLRNFSIWRLDCFHSLLGSVTSSIIYCPNDSYNWGHLIVGNVDIYDVQFAYPSRKEILVLQGFTLSIPAGKVVALVGSSGCGKSTIMSLISRFYDPTKGEIFIDNHNIKDLDLKSLRRYLGLVSQEPSLFSGNIRDNIKAGNMNADDDQIQKAAQMANAHPFISQLPDKYLTEVGQRGTQLSGGQKQRIAIARAILKNPPILLLDEATSALDTESEKLVQAAIETAMQGRTVIVIAHRLSTIINADMIAVVENGKVAETGRHHDLLNNNKFYYNLFTMQNISQESNTRVEDSTEELASIQTQISSQNPNQPDEHGETSRTPKLTIKEEKLQERVEKSLFFRIWFDLKKRDIIKLAIGSSAAALAGISKPVFGFFIITIGVAYYKDDPKHRVGSYSMMFAAIGFLSLLSNTLQHYYFGVVGEKAMKNLRQALYSVILQNELAWFEMPENNVGSITSRVINETSTVKTIISDRMSVIVQCISSIVIATTVSIRVNWRMGLVAWAVMPCHFIGGLIQAKSAKGFSSGNNAAYSELVALASESTANIKTIASFCQEEHVLEKAKVTLKKPLIKSREQSIKYGIIQGVSLCLWNIAHAVALWYTAILVERKQAKFEDGIRSYQIFSLTVPSITELWTLIPTVFSAMSILTPVFQTLDRQTEIKPDLPNQSPSEIIKGEVEFRNVQFSYPLRPEIIILDNFCLKIEAASKVALVGPSGAGKSSVLALLLRFYDAKGELLIDGKDIRNYNLRNLRTHIGLVQQEPLLFSCSIRDNISYGNEGASEAEIIQVSIDANIHEVISNLPRGYDTLVGEKGCQLSGGQKQRIAIARALLKKPAIMLLDEATSALDAESERAVINALESLKLRTTQITVAHRLSTVINSDNIVVMDKGKVMEMGTHATLIAANDGIYSRLSRLQSITKS